MNHIGVFITLLIVLLISQFILNMKEERQNGEKEKYDWWTFIASRLLIYIPFEAIYWTIKIFFIDN